MRKKGLYLVTGTITLILAIFLGSGFVGLILFSSLLCGSFSVIDGNNSSVPACEPVFPWLFGPQLNYVLIFVFSTVVSVFMFLTYFKKK